MKMNKWFMLGMVGLAFTACSNEEDVTESKFPAGNGAVSVKIVSPTITKGISTGNSADVTVVPGTDSKVVITLTDNSVTNPTQKIILSATDWGTGKVVTFWNVTEPKKIEVSMNGGKATYATEDVITGGGLQEVANVPAYGATESFTLTADMKSPVIGNDNDTNTAGAEQGAVEGDQNKKYQIYTATVEMAIPVARLEVSGIKHITGSHVTGNDPGNCKYSTLTIAGVYLDNVIPNGDGVEYSTVNSAFTNGENPQDYCFAEGKGTGDVAILKNGNDEEGFGPTDFLTTEAQWPTDGKAFGYNFFGAKNEINEGNVVKDNLPKFKIYFSESVAENPDHPLPAPRYAMITKYWKNDAKTEEVTEFKPGTIYRITSATLTDDNIIGDEGGNTLYGVEVTVEEAEWAVQTIYADWAE